MPYFTVAGKPNCPDFVHVKHVAAYLEEHLPNFNLRIIQLTEEKWPEWISNVNLVNGWHHTRGPVVWKAISMRGGKPYLIGGISEFWEYCSDFYGLESVLPPGEVQKLVSDNLQYWQEATGEQKRIEQNVSKVCIVGAANRMIVHLLPELLEITIDRGSSTTIIDLYDENCESEDVREFLDGIVEDIAPLSTNGDVETVRVVEKLETGIEGCDIAIVIADYSRKLTETEYGWLLRNLSAMNMLADVINAKAKRTLKLILAFHGPVCFNASILATTCTRIRIPNIVAVTSDTGAGPLNEMAKQADVPLQDVGGPPVWGFVGNYEFVDVEHAVMCSDVYRPYRRVLGNKGGSTLPLGTVVRELRNLTYLMNQTRDVIGKSRRIRETVTERLQGPPVLAKVRATISLLKLWCAHEASDDEIISLGVCSNGCFGFPAGVVFSQPVMLENKYWRPFKDFPVSKAAGEANQEIVIRSLALLQKFVATSFTTEEDYSIESA